jgi:hypothetical protein
MATDPRKRGLLEGVKRLILGQQPIDVVSNNPAVMASSRARATLPQTQELIRQARTAGIQGFTDAMRRFPTTVPQRIDYPTPIKRAVSNIQRPSVRLPIQAGGFLAREVARAPFRVAAGTAGIIGTEGARQGGQKVRPQEYLANLGTVGEGAVDLLTGGAATKLPKLALKGATIRGLKQGAKLGGAAGTSIGLQEGRDEPLLGQLLQAGKQGGIGTGLGGAIGGVAAPLGAAAGKVYRVTTNFAKKFNKVAGDSFQLVKSKGGYKLETLRSKTGQFQGSRKVRTDGQMFAGGLYGFERDEEGMPTFNPQKAALGIAGMATVKRVGGLSAGKESLESLKKKHFEISSQMEALDDVLSQHPAKGLAKYVSRSGDYAGGLKEVTGKGNTAFSRFGDDVASGLGFPNSEEARKAFGEYQNLRQLKEGFKNQLKETLVQMKQARQSAVPTSSKIKIPTNTYKQGYMTVRKTPIKAQKAPDLMPRQRISTGTAGRLSAGQEAVSAVSPKTSLTPPVASTTPPALISGSSPQSLRDIGSTSKGFRDVYRNFKAVFGSNYGKVKQQILDPFDASKGRMIDDQKRLAAELDNNIVRALGIRKGSKESAAVQQFGEKLIDQATLIKKFGQERAAKIIRADQWFRAQYDKLLDEVNTVRAQIYPSNPDKIIPRRENYYRHFQELSETLGGMKNIFDTPAQISPKLAGASDFTQPRSKWLSFAQRRTGNKTDHDAVGGYIDYIKSQTYAKNIDPHIKSFRDLGKQLAEATSEGPMTGKLNNFIEFLSDYSNDLAGKTNPLDRGIQKYIPGGRMTFKLLDATNKRIKANVILGNASSAIAQIFNVPQGIASAGRHSVMGLKDTVMGALKGSELSKSSFIKERYAQSIFDKFDTGMIANTKKGAVWITQALDELGTKYIWHSHYRKALAEGARNPIKYADDFTREMVAGRGVGEVPLVQKSKVFQMVAPFQLEVANLWHVMKGFVDEKSFGKLAALFISLHVFNKGAEKIRGSGVAFDPIEAIIDAVQIYREEDDKKVGAIRAGGRLAGEVLSNIPLGQTAAALYPQYGVKIPGTDEKLTRKEFFGREDPTRFGSGLLVMKGLQDPLYKLLPPFGGQQIQRTRQGLQSYIKGASETAKGQVRFPVKKTGLNAVKSAVFGQYSTPEAREYFGNQRTPLSDKQSELFRQSPDKRGVYTKIMQDRQAEKEEGALKEKVKQQGGVQSIGNKLMYMDGDSVKTLDINKITAMPESSYYEQANKQKEINSTLKQLLNSNLSDEQKNSALKQLGVPREKAEYYVVATDTADLRAAFLKDALKDVPREQYINTLAQFRRSVNDKTIATGTASGSLGLLEKEGIITKEERLALEKITFDGKTGKATSNASGARKAKIPKPKKPTMPKIKVIKTTKRKTRTKVKKAPMPKIQDLMGRTPERPVLRIK